MGQERGVVPDHGGPLPQRHAEERRPAHPRLAPGVVRPKRVGGQGWSDLLRPLRVPAAVWRRPAGPAPAASLPEEPWRERAVPAAHVPGGEQPQVQRDQLPAHRRALRAGRRLRGGRGEGRPARLEDLDLHRERPRVPGLHQGGQEDGLPRDHRRRVEPCGHRASGLPRREGEGPGQPLRRLVQRQELGSIRLRGLVRLRRPAGVPQERRAGHRQRGRAQAPVRGDAPLDGPERRWRSIGWRGWLASGRGERDSDALLARMVRLRAQHQSRRLHHRRDLDARRRVAGRQELRRGDELRVRQAGDPVGLQQGEAHHALRAGSPSRRTAPGLPQRVHLCDAEPARQPRHGSPGEHGLESRPRLQRAEPRAGSAELQREQARRRALSARATACAAADDLRGRAHDLVRHRGGHVGQR